MKWLVTLCLLVASVVLANEPNFTTEKGKDRNNGAPLIRVVSYEPRVLYCYVLYNNGYGHFDFYVYPAGSTRPDGTRSDGKGSWYYEPTGYYEVWCK